MRRLPMYIQLNLELSKLLIISKSHQFLVELLQRMIKGPFSQTFFVRQAHEPQETHLELKKANRNNYLFFLKIEAYVTIF